MKNVMNWKAWQKGNVKRIYVADGKYFDEGETGLCNAHGLTAEEINFASKVIGNQTFAQMFYKCNVCKASKKNEKAIKKAIQEKYGFGTHEMSCEELKAMNAEIKSALAE